MEWVLLGMQGLVLIAIGLHGFGHHHTTSTVVYENRVNRDDLEELKKVLKEVVQPFDDYWKIS